MNTRLSSIQQHRAVLVARAAAQRREMGEIINAWSGPIALVERLAAVFRRLRVSPLVIPAAAALLFWMKRHHKWRWAGHLITAWEIFSSLRRLRANRS
jgi:hypothetical protein